MVDRLSPRRAAVWPALRDALDALSGDRGALSILDAGGGTGGFAVPLAGLGHSVTVVDPNPDSLAALERRAAEAQVSALVRGVQGDAAGVSEVVDAASYDAVLCHSLLEVVDDPAGALTGLARALRPGGVASILAANRTAAVLARAVSGRLADAVAVLTDPDGRAGEHDAVRRRFVLSDLLALVDAAGLRAGPAHGVRVFTDLVPGALLDDPQAAAALAELERRVADTPAFRDIATQLHLLAFAD